MLEIGGLFGSAPAAPAPFGQPPANAPAPGFGFGAAPAAPAPFGAPAPARKWRFVWKYLAWGLGCAASS